ncbi:unnamed protein product [Paramecium primaurelia]|uniref:protein-serine/threonine phosphatase n=1 Tax=Paramecium primaurelia TaxID=5886 RepID=A0A8S1LA20_PARPR|nr:unnamed protein product [Paramecium primaurelia]
MINYIILIKLAKEFFQQKKIKDQILVKTQNSELILQKKRIILQNKIQNYTSIIHLLGIFSKEPNVTKVPTPVTIFGDIHGYLKQKKIGQLYVVEELVKVGGKHPFTNYLFLGDYADRVAHSVEVIKLLSLLKVKFQNTVTQIRGNHKIRGNTQNYGFYTKCQQKYGNSQGWEYFTAITCIVGTIYYVCMEVYLFLQRVLMKQTLFLEVKCLRNFYISNNMPHLIRTHQLCDKGFNLKFEDRYITVWSEPNYLYRNGNLASIVEEQNQRYFNIFSEIQMIKDLGTKSIMLEADITYFI